MNFLRKFYNTAIAEPAAGTETVDVAAAMAKSGKIVEAGQSVATQPPVEIKEEPKTESAKVETPAATANVETKVEKVEETPKPAEEAKVETPKEEAKPAQLSWQEVLKQQQPDTVLKELGFDDTKISLLSKLDPKMVAFLNKWESKEDVTAYLREMTTDYSKMPAEEIMRHNLRQEYPKASEKAIEALFKKEVVDAYQLDPDKYSEDEVEQGRLLLDAKADKLRESFAAKQQEYLIPPPPEASPEIADNSEDERTAKFEAYKSQVSNNQYTKDIFTNKVLALGEGDEKFTFPIDPTEVTDILFDSGKWSQTMFETTLDDKGNKTLNPKVEHQFLVASVAKYGKAFLDAYAAHFKAIGGKKVIEPIENAKPADQQTITKTDIKPDNPAAAMAKAGRLVS